MVGGGGLKDFSGGQCYSQQQQPLIFIPLPYIYLNNDSLMFLKLENHLNNFTHSTIPLLIIAFLRFIESKFKEMGGQNMFSKKMLLFR